MVQLNHPSAPQPQSLYRPLGKSLRLKLTLVLILTSLIPLALLFNLTGNQLPPATFGQILLISGTVWTISIFLLWWLLRPLHNLYEGLKTLNLSHTDYIFNIKTGDEFEAISQSLNNVAKNLNQAASLSTKAQEDMLIEKNKLHTIIASITDGVVVLDLHHHIVLANKAAEKITGFTFQELNQQPSDSFLIFRTKDSKTVGAAELCQIGQSNPVPSTLTLTDKSRQEKQVEVVAAPIAEGIQADLGCVLIIYDTTAHKTFEQMQIDFVSMASHEIRTPLTSIINYLQTISEEAGQKLDPELKGFLDRSLQSAKQLSTLVTNLLNVSKVERGSFSVSLQPLNWQKKLSQLVEDSKGLAIQKGLFLTLKPPPAPLPQVMADDIRINEVVNNLISNAINYSKPNGTIEVSTQVEGNEVVTAVADNGQGIPKEALPHLFTKFFRVSGSLEQMKQGSGLGLYMSKSIVDMHRGRIWVKSELGKGSTFFFSLPIATNARPTIANLLKASPTTAPLS